MGPRDSPDTKTLASRHAMLNTSPTISILLKNGTHSTADCPLGLHWRSIVLVGQSRLPVLHGSSVGPRSSYRCKVPWSEPLPFLGWVAHQMRGFQSADLEA